MVLSHKSLRAAAVAVATLAATAATSMVSPATGQLGSTPTADADAPATQHHERPGYVAPAPESARPGKKLPVKQGTVKVDTGLELVPGSGSETTTPQPPDTAGSPSPRGTDSSRDLEPSRSSLTQTTVAEGLPGSPETAVTPSTNKVALRALVLTVDAADYGLPTWKSTLDRVGAQYDVLETKNAPLTADRLVQPDGTGRYNAILLTDGMQLYDSGSGGYVSGLDDSEWNILWAYERDFGVRQATLYSSYGTWPEDYCLRQGTEGGVGDTALTTSLTTAGASSFDYLKGSATIPITQSYVYRDALASNCSAEPLLTSGSDTLGVRTTSTDGRERMALTFTSNQHLIQANLLVFGLFRWASRGLYLGEQRHFLNVDVDDWFNSTDERYPDGTINMDPGFRMSAHDAYNTSVQQKNLRTKYSLASAFKLNLAYNAGDANRNAGSTCYPNGSISQLTATSKCLRNEFSWINHTYTHPKMNFTDYATSFDEIKRNLDVAKNNLGLTVPKEVLKTGEYSGLGVYNPDVNNDVDPPTDYGLNASNPDLLAAAKALGVKFMHGNMSFKSHQPACFNCGVIHPMEPTITIVPDWPTNIAYFSTTPEEETSFYNWYYGPNGKFAYWPKDLTYPEIIDYEAEVALQHLASGSLYSHTMHIGNLRDYGGGKNLVFDWADAVVRKYSSYYSVPLLTPNWSKLAVYAADRNRHFDELAAGVQAVYDPVTGTITVRSPAAGTVTLSGASTTGSTTYGSDVSAPVTLKANTPVTVPARRLP